jgi:hypothetical protein
VRPTKPVGGQPVPGVIETLSAGFEQINRIPWILSLPILVDLFLWLAPGISAAPVIHRWTTQVLDLYQNIAASGVDPSAVDQARQSLGALDAAAVSFNVLSLLVLNVAAVPSIAPSSLTGTVAQEISSGAVFAFVVLLTIVLGGLLGCLYLGAIAQQVRDKRFDLVILLRRVWFYWLSVIGFIVIAGLFIIVVLIPVTIIVGLAQYAVPGSGAALLTVVLTFGYVALVLFAIYLFFLVSAIVVSEVGPVRAAISSARVVANNFWTSVGFIVLYVVISLGMQVVWTALSASVIGTAAAIAGNAYIASGLAAASMLYYSSRVSRLPAPRGALGRVGVRQE